jgi:hypothetical protein
MKHYVYKIEDIITGEFYFGSRSYNGNPIDDLYMGSMKTWKPIKSNLIKIIINDTFTNRDSATIYEKKIIKESINHPLNRNYNIPNIGFPVCAFGIKNPNYGKTHTIQWKFTHSEKMKEYYKSNKASNLGKKFDENWKNNISKGRKLLKIAKGSSNPNSYGKVKIVDLKGDVLIFDTAKEASEKLKTDRFTLTNHCKHNTSYKRGKYKGWNFSLLYNTE